MFLRYLTLHKTEKLCCLTLNSASGCEKNQFGMQVALKKIGCVGRMALSMMPPGIRSQVSLL